MKCLDNLVFINKLGRGRELGGMCWAVWLGRNEAVIVRNCDMVELFLLPEE